MRVFKRILSKRNVCYLCGDTKNIHRKLDIYDDKTQMCTQINCCDHCALLVKICNSKNL